MSDDTLLGDDNRLLSRGNSREALPKRSFVQSTYLNLETANNTPSLNILGKFEESSKLDSEDRLNNLRIQNEDLLAAND